MKITNARIVLLDRVIENGTIEIENERIIGIREGIEKDSDIDAGGKYLAPGIFRIAFVSKKLIPKIPIVCTILFI